MSIHQLCHFLTEELYLTKEDAENAALPLGKQPLSAAPTSMAAPPPSVELKKEEQEIEPIRIKGNFEKGVLITHEEEALKPEVMDMLVKMINAVGHSMNEVGMVSSSEMEGKTMENFTALNAHTVLKFGRIKHPLNAIPATPYEIYTADETEYLFADSLTTISEDKELKRKLWNTLQILFNISKNK